MDFSDKSYVRKLNNILNTKLESTHDKYDCFFQLINGVKKESLDNLIKLMLEFIQSGHKLTEEDCYKMLQNTNLDKSLKETIFNLAYNCLDKGLPLGNNINEYGFNDSNWIGHSLQEARLCSIIASKSGLDQDKAFRLGILHDYGRKYTQSFRHVVEGFEKLSDLGYYEESIGCLTHSFINGNYFACYNPSKDYIVDENLNAITVNEELKKTDVYQFLSRYYYTDYDRILNIADLMATHAEIISPENRILDIEKRRKLEGRQKEYFFSQLQNAILWCLQKMNIDLDDYSTKDFKELSDLILKVVNDKKNDKKGLKL